MKKPLILEVGSGDNPREKSTILLDRFIHSNSQRAGEFNIRINRPMVVGDGYNLPFKDKQFDYVICSHVLEHLEDPAAFATELMRVGKAGYVEVPNILSERLFGWGFHLWYCEYKNNTLFFTPKKHGQRFGNFFHQLIAKEIWFRRFFDTHENKFYIKFEWQKSFKMQVNKHEYKSEYVETIDREIDTLLEGVDWNKKDDFFYYAQWMIKRIIKKMKKEVRQLFWIMRSTFYPNTIISAMVPLLRCPACHGSLVYQSPHVSCMGCDKQYLLEGTIPIMLSEKERKKGY